MLSLQWQELLQKAKTKTGYDNLEQREKLVITLGAVVVLALIFFHLIVSPLMTSRTRLKKTILDKRVELKKIATLQKEYEEVASLVGDIADRVAKRQGDFTLFSFLERQATAAKVKERVKYMKPSMEEGEGTLQNSLVEMKLEKITLVQLVDFLKLAESNDDVVSIGRISIQESGKEEGLLDVVLQIVTFVEKT